MQSLSVVIITLNEERNIRRCIASVKPVADEIIVLDAFSSDRTPEICRELGVRFEQRAWEGYSASKNHLNSLATGDYILSLDADEALSGQLRNELLSAKKNGLNGIYSVNRITNYCGEWIRHSGWFPDVKPRLFPREACKWEGAFVHEELVCGGDLPQHLFSGLLEHYSYHSFADHRQRADKYSVLTAQKFHAAGKKAGALKPYLSAAGRFVAMYLLKKGFLDGRMGLKIATISAQSNVLKYKELRRLNRGQKD
jgi:hypothetical protein